MAEIHVQAKKNNTNTSWVWIVLVLIIAAAVIYFLTRDNTDADRDNQVTPAAPASFIQPAHGFYVVEAA